MEWPEAKKVLIVDDDRITSESMANYFKVVDIAAVTAINSDEAIEVFQSAKPDVVVVDYNLGKNVFGSDVIGRIRKVDSSARCILMSANYRAGEVAQLLGVPFYCKGDIRDLVKLVKG